MRQAERRHMDRAFAVTPGGGLQEGAVLAAGEVLVRLAEGRLDGLAAQAAELLERQVESFGWRFDSVPLLWVAGVDAALAVGGLATAERLDALGARPTATAARLDLADHLEREGRAGDAAEVLAEAAALAGPFRAATTARRTGSAVTLRA